MPLVILYCLVGVMPCPRKSQKELYKKKRQNR